jgi:biotin synthase
VVDLALDVAANRFDVLADKALSGERLSRAEALSILATDDDDLLALLHAGFRIRRAHFGRKVKLNMLINAKSGLCPEDCGYCSQSVNSTAPIERYGMLDEDVLVEGAREAWARRAGTYCIVASGRGPTKRDIPKITAAVRRIKAELPIKVCACLGLLSADDAAALAEAGVDRYNHNLNMNEDLYGAITTTHTYNDRLATLEAVKSVGISPCSGLIAGMGEQDHQLVDLTFALRDLDADSIPVNFLHAIEGTALAGRHDLDPRRCLKTLALLRFVCPTKEIRVAGGREVNLGSLQPLALYVANSIFIGDYLTTPGQEAEADYQMIADLGFEIEKCAL